MVLPVREGDGVGDAVEVAEGGRSEIERMMKLYWSACRGARNKTQSRLPSPPPRPPGPPIPRTHDEGVGTSGVHGDSRGAIEHRGSPGPIRVARDALAARERSHGSRGEGDATDEVVASVGLSFRIIMHWQ